MLLLCPVLQSRMGKCKITEVQQHTQNVVSPIIIGWDHGTLKEEMLSSSVCDIQKKQGSTSFSSVQVSIGENTVYEGEITQKPLCRTFIAVRSKSKKKPSHSKVKLFEASSSLLVERKSEVITQDSKFSELDKADKFYKVFGSKKGLRQHESTQKMYIVSGTVRDSLQQTLDAVKVDVGSSEGANSSGDGSILPPCNRFATNKEDVYRVDTIIPEDIMNELETDAVAVMALVKTSSTLSEEEYTSFFIQSVAAITKSSAVKIEPDVLKQRLKMLIFCELLLKLINSRRDLERSNKGFCLASNLPSTNQYILDNYTALSGGKRMLTIQNQDKVLCHVIILVLLSCCYVLNLKILCSSVPFSADKIGPMLQIVGVTPAPGTDKMYLLKTPLPPLPTAGGRLRRGTKRKH